jgi:hypothetical protein
MDDRRFDSLVRALAEGKSRRSVLKGFLGLGGAAAVGGTLLEGGTDAARRPTPTPTPVRCPGNQTPVNGVCTCPASAPFECGPDCCTSEAGGPPTPTHSECCDNACCFGTCYGEELCCPTNDRSAGEFPIPPTHKICESAVNGTECCELDAPCCEVDGCCDTVCWAGNAFCCSQEAFCPGGGSVEDVCCVNEGDQLFACCNGGTDARVCYDTSVDGACCTDADCNDPCLVCNAATNICEPRCDAENEVCCTEQAGPGVCVTGECCLGAPCPNMGDLCCLTPEGTQCLDVEVCPDECDCPEGTTCCRESATAPVICVLGDSCACDNFCGPIETDANNGSYYCCTEPDYTICCDGPESECCGGPAGRQCQPNGHCCEAATPLYCPGDGSIEPSCCATACNPLNGACTPSDACQTAENCDACEVCQMGLCQPCEAVGLECCSDGVCREACEVQLCLPEGQTCPNAAGLQCCEGLGCCGGQCCASANCCEDSSVCCGPNCARCEADICVEDCRVGFCLCLEGQTCDQQTGLCVPVLVCEDLGSQCSLDTDCCSGLCDVTSLCVDCKQPGGSCVDDSDCCNNNCDENACS